VGKLGIARSEFWDMTFPELIALTADVPKPGAGGLTSDEQAELYRELQEEGLLPNGGP
jgi:hypothetical protein